MKIPGWLLGEAYSVRGAVVLTAAGSVIEVGHEKFLLVVGNFEGDVYLCVINSRPYRFHPEAQVPISVDDLPALSHASYVDCSKLKRLGKQAFVESLKNGTFVAKGRLSGVAMAHVLRAGRCCPNLNRFERKIFE